MTRKTLADAGGFPRLGFLQFAFFVLFGWGFWARGGPIDKQGRRTGPPRFHLSTSKRECQRAVYRGLPLSLLILCTCCCPPPLPAVLPSFRKSGPATGAVGGPLPPVLNGKA